MTMNKAKAYRQLRKKNSQLKGKYAWLENSHEYKPAATLESALNIQSVQLLDYGESTSDTQENDAMRDKPQVIRLKYSHPLKPLLCSENTTLEKSSEEFLPNIQTCFTLLKKSGLPEQAMEKLKDNRRPETSRTNSNQTAQK